MKSFLLLLLTVVFANGYPTWPLQNQRGIEHYKANGKTTHYKRVPEIPQSSPAELKIWKSKFNPNFKTENSGKLEKRQWFVQNDVDSRFPLPERRRFPEVDWRGFNEDVFHESFGDFTPMKKWSE